jgi:hypothetical protein
VRILHLTTEFPPVIYGGLGTVVGGWVNASAHAGVDVAVQLVEGPLVLGAGSRAYGGLQQPAIARSSSVIHHDGVTFFQCSWSNTIEIGIRLIREWRADIVHLHTAMLWYVAHALHGIESCLQCSMSIKNSYLRLASTCQRNNRDLPAAVQPGSGLSVLLSRACVSLEPGNATSDRASVAGRGYFLEAEMDSRPVQKQSAQNSASCAGPRTDRPAFRESR